MSRKHDFQKAMNFTRSSVYFACTWPPSIAATKCQIISFNIRWWFTVVSILGLLFPLIVSIAVYHDDSVIVTQSACFIGSTANVMTKMIVFRYYYKSTQTLISDMEFFFETAQPHEKMVLRRYVSRCWLFHVFISTLNYLAPAMVLLSPFLLTHEEFPTHAIYPFPVNSIVVKSLVYMHHGMVGVQCASGVSSDCQAAMMMWYAGARLEILADEIKFVKDVRGLEDFVVKHRKLLSYAVEVSKSMRYVALSSSMTSGLTAIMSALQLVGNQPLEAKMQFVPLVFVATINLFVCAWPADNLINVCELLGNASYGIPWADMPVSMIKNLIMIIQRCQRPIVVSVGGLLPTLSLQSYAKFLSAVFSYFTTLRAVTSDGAK